MKNNKKLRKVIFKLPEYRKINDFPVGFPIGYYENNGYFHKFIDNDKALVEDTKGYLHTIYLCFIRFFEWE